MNSRTCTILSKHFPVSGRSVPISRRVLRPRGSALPLYGGAVAVLAFLIMGCGSSVPAPREPDPAPVQVQQPGENGEGTISFHYSNKSTDANLAIDLGNTDLYMEMSGEPPKLANGEPAVAEEKRPPPKPKAAKPQAQEQDQEEPEQGEPEAPRAAMRKKAEAKPEARSEAKKEADSKKELQLPEEEQADFTDVTSRVLAGIRKSQELFYQKRYPEAMQAVKSSLDARPTAEGYALAGSIHYMMGQGGMARRQWMEALRLNPDMPSVVNMLEKTRTPGGRGSPSPRPILPRPVQRLAPAPLPEAEDPPFPEVYNEPAYNYPSAPAAHTATPSEATQAPAPQAPVPEAAEPAAAAQAEPAVVAPHAPVAPAPVPAVAPAAAPAATPSASPSATPSANPPASPAAPVKTPSGKAKLPSAKPAKEGNAK